MVRSATDGERGDDDESFIAFRPGMAYGKKQLRVEVATELDIAASALSFQRL